MAKQDFSQQPSQTLAKAMAILDAFSDEQPERGIRELGRELGINSATVYRLVTTLSGAGYLEQDPETQRYSLGPKFLRLANLYALHNPISVVTRKVFESYADRFEHNFYLSKLSNFEVVYLAVLDGRGPIRIVVEAGRRAALHATATGKLLLAYCDDDYIGQFLEVTELKAYTPRTVTDGTRLWQQLEEIRRREYAINDGEYYEDVGAVSVPLFDSRTQSTLGVCLAYPRHLVIQERVSVEELIPLAREIAEEIGRRMADLTVMPAEISQETDQGSRAGN